MKSFALSYLCTFKCFDFLLKEDEKQLDFNESKSQSSEL